VTIIIIIIKNVLNSDTTTRTP